MAENNNVENFGNIPVDSTIEITVAANQTEAYINISEPAFGGKAPSYEDVLKQIEFNRVVHGIEQNVLHSILDEQRFGYKVRFAYFTPAVNGADGEITYHYSKDNDLAPVEDDRGFVDYKDLGLVRNVTVGTVIADITLPTDGVDGTDVRGNTLRSIPGKKAKYAVGINTTLTDDGTQIIASIDGNLNFKGGAFVVDNVVNINGNVDASTGNIDFTGDVIVKGEVTEGFKVNSNANIVVNGNVNGATIVADGDIVIKKGCINSTIKAGGSVTINFCEYSKIKCEGDLVSTNFMICDVYCGGSLSTKGSKGGLHGGKYTCLHSVEAYDIGTKNYIKTELTVGDNAILKAEKDTLLVKIADLEHKVNDINLIINFLKEKQKELKRLPEDKEQLLGASVRQKVVLGVDISKCTKRIAEIDDALTKRQFLSISAKGIMYPGVKVTINDESFKIEYEYARSKVYLDNDGLICVGPL